MKKPVKIFRRDAALRHRDPSASCAFAVSVQQNVQNTRVFGAVSRLHDYFHLAAAGFVLGNNNLLIDFLF